MASEAHAYASVAVIDWDQPIFCVKRVVIWLVLLIGTSLFLFCSKTASIFVETFRIHVRLA